MQNWVTPEIILALDIAVLCALTVAICVGAQVIRKLNVLYAARSEWARELSEFSSRADAAESGLSRLRAVLLAEAEWRASQAALDTSAADVAPAQGVASSPPVAKPARGEVGRSRGLGADNSRAAIMSMQ